MENKIIEYLKELESTENIKILYSCESGSRMWGIAFEDSDYDVRFVYSKPLEYYLSIDDKSDVIDINNCKSDVVQRAKLENIDIVGWDIRKYLYLLSKSNSVCFEWLKSPIVYKLDNVSDSYFRIFMKDLTKQYFNFKNIFLSYYWLAKHNTERYLKDDLVYIKKYLYTIRPIAVCQWMLDNQNEDIIPVDFNILKQSLHTTVLFIVNGILLDRSSEKNRSLRLKKLDEYIEIYLKLFDKEIKNNNIFKQAKQIDNSFINKTLYQIILGKY